MKKNGNTTHSDVKRAAKHVIQPHEYEEAPMLTDEMFARAVHKKNGKPLGRPIKADKKISVHLRLDSDVCASFRATGAGWQTRINDLLREHMPNQ